MRRPAILRLHVKKSFSDTHVGIKSKVHVSFSLSQPEIICVFS
jgi:hypothetical protein